MPPTKCPGRLTSKLITHRMPELPVQELEEHKTSTKPDLISAAKACSRSYRDLATANKIHAHAIRTGYHSDIHVATSLVDMFAKCNSMSEACQVFQKMPCHNPASWTALMLGYVENGEDGLALESFPSVSHPDALCYVAALVACSNLATKEEGRRIDSRIVKLNSLERGMAIHSQVAENRFESVASVSNTLISLYSKSGSLLDARAVFDRASHHSVVSWNSLILGYAENGEPELALDLFSCMRRDEPCWDVRTFIAALAACTSLALREEDGEYIHGRMVKVRSLERGMAVHSQAEELGLASHVFLASSLVNFYARCGSLEDARAAFERLEHRDVVSWTALILGYAENGEGEMALELFTRMQTEGFQPDARTYVAAVKGCAALTASEEGKQIGGKLLKLKCLEIGLRLHSQASELGFQSNIFLATSLVDLYAQCGSLLDARTVFDRMPLHNMVCWNALILGYAVNGEAEVALELFFRMKDEAFAPEQDARAFVAVMVACGSLVAVLTGRRLHADICNSGLETNVFVANCLVDFYCKCGNMSHAQVVFDTIYSKNLFTWSTLIGGYSRHGDSEMVFRLFKRLREEGLQADSITYLSVLTACSHSGLVEQGRGYFEEMVSLGMKPGMEHYDCMVDLLSRGNRLDEALQLVRSMPLKPNVVTWNAVLGACRKWKDVEIARLAFDNLVKLDEKQASSYLTMASIYGAAGMWREQAQVLEMKRIAKPWKEPAVSWWTDNAGVIHRFKAGDLSRHSQGEEIAYKLKELLVKMKAEGYVAEVSSVSSSRLSDGEKEDLLCEHSERLAISCALINTAPGATVRVIKNLRVCNDCHTATCLISKVERRKIICRDSSRFHIFEGGKCCCGNFW